jgi:hypothetical protein
MVIRLATCNLLLAFILTGLVVLPVKPSSAQSASCDLVALQQAKATFQQLAEQPQGPSAPGKTVRATTT